MNMTNRCSVAAAVNDTTAVLDSCRFAAVNNGEVGDEGEENLEDLEL